MAKEIWRMCKRKLRFKTEWDANALARKWGQRSYECPVCQGYHLTKSKDQR